MLAELTTFVMRENVKREKITHHVLRFTSLGRPTQVSHRIFIGIGGQPPVSPVSVEARHPCNHGRFNVASW
jgi:hypothetical protein